MFANRICLGWRQSLSNEFSQLFLSDMLHHFPVRSSKALFFPEPQLGQSGFHLLLPIRASQSEPKYRVLRKICMLPLPRIFAHQDERSPLIWMRIALPDGEHGVAHCYRLVFAILIASVELRHEIRCALVVDIPQAEQ